MSRDFSLVDVSHSVEDGMVTYKGLPPPVISEHLSREASKAHYDAGTEFHIGKVEMVANTGTYLDSPFHRYPDGTDLSGLDLYDLAYLEGIVVRVADQGSRSILKAAIENIEVRGKAIVFHTGWDKHWRTAEYLSGLHPFLSEEASQYLADSGVALVGIDSYNIDNTQVGSRPAHSILLGAGIPIVEHLCNLSDLPDSGFKFFAVPVKVKGMGTFPVRAFGLIHAPTH